MTKEYQAVVKANKAVTDHYIKNQAAISEYENLLRARDEAEKEFKLKVKESGESWDMPELGVKFTLSRPYKTIIDAEKAFKVCGDQNQSKLLSIAVIEPQAYQSLIIDGQLPNEARLAIYEEPKEPIVSKRATKHPQDVHGQ